MKRIFLLSLILTGCSTTTLVHNPQLTAPKSFGLHFGSGFAYTPGRTKPIVLPGVSPWHSDSTPIIEAGARTGIAQDLDVGAQLTLFGPLATDLRYRFMSYRGVTVATGVNMSLLITTSIDPNPDAPLTEGTSVSALGGGVPLYLSYDWNDAFTLFAALRAEIRLFTIGDRYNDSLLRSTRSVTRFLFGENLGVRIGTKRGFLVELASLHGLQWGYQEYQLAGSYFMNF